MKQTFSYAVCGAALAALLAGCSGINALIKSGQPELIYSKALEYYKIGKWQRASTLFESAQPYYTGTSREDSISFYNAYCKFKNRDFDTASTLLDDFRRKFGRSAFIEDAEGMYALCFYYLSPGPTRDQTMTGQAIMAINEFMSRYPESDRIEDFRKINEELTGRLHEKAYINAYTYYKIGRYKSAIVALKNALKQYPESGHREEIMYLIVDASYRFASNSVHDKQTDRYLDMLDSYLSFREEFPESKYNKELERMAQHARDYLDRNNKDNNIPNNTITRKLVDLDKETGNIYESVNIIARRANQISTELKAELNRKLADFSSPTDTMEETFENREQIEISRYYERLPKPVIIATEEFLDHELLFKEGKDGEMKEI